MTALMKFGPMWKRGGAPFHIRNSLVLLSKVVCGLRRGRAQLGVYEMSRCYGKTVWVLYIALESECMIVLSIGPIAPKKLDISYAWKLIGRVSAQLGSGQRPRFSMPFPIPLSPFLQLCLFVSIHPTFFYPRDPWLFLAVARVIFGIFPGRSRVLFVLVKF